MKKIFLLLLLATTMAFSQQKEGNVDSLKIYKPKNHKVLKVLTNPQLLERTLDSLRVAEKTDVFNVVAYLDNGIVLQCTFRKKHYSKSN
jgi:hypothetical protein